MTKAEIRKTATQRRKGLNAVEVDSLTQQLLSNFKKLPLGSTSVIHLFLPIAEKNEPNTFLFIDWIQQYHPGIKIIVPRADFNTSLMTHHEYTGTAGLTKNSYDIPEPQFAALYTGKIDLVLIPMLAFDQLGYRVGYGKGFYDRFLQHTNAQKIGLSFFEAEEEHIADVNVHDVKMDLCICPQRTYTFA